MAASQVITQKMEAICAKTLGRMRWTCPITRSRTDQAFHSEDNEEEVRHLKHGECCGIRSGYGHLADSKQEWT